MQMPDPNPDILARKSRIVERLRKVLPPDAVIADEAEKLQTVRRFREEAHAIASLNHVNIVTIYDVDEDESGLYIAMEVVDGRPLDALLREQSGSIPESQAIELFTGVCAGVLHAHRRRRPDPRDGSE